MSGRAARTHALVTCDDEIIREGIRAMLADRYLNAKAEACQRASHGWTTRQIADETLLSHLGNLRHYWEAYADPQKRREARERFDQYAYQWY
ncbi:MAG: hypothetical protein RBS80_23860 [Thermoguttaceae bacterium]|nr:hypothetical protein [Thermoguttaceae bacterium]